MAGAEQNPWVAATCTSPTTTVPETLHQNLPAKHQLQRFTCTCNNNMFLIQERRKGKFTVISDNIFGTTSPSSIAKNCQVIPVYWDTSLIQTKDHPLFWKQMCRSWKILCRPWKWLSPEFQLNRCMVMARAHNRLVKVSFSIHHTDFSVSNIYIFGPEIC